MQVNRYLKDKAMDRIDHALGRPIDPMAETYRDYFATNAEGSQAAEFRASPHWDQGVIRGDMAWFHVSDDGRSALRDHLIEIGDPHRLYTVTWDGWDMPQVATSRSKARYAKWLSVSDSYDISFKDFAATAKVRVALSNQPEGGAMTAMREDIWRDLYEKRDALIAAIEAAHASPPRDFTEGDRREWQEIAHALDYHPQKWADQQRSS